jgi:hypothetical protein
LLPAPQRIQADAAPPMPPPGTNPYPEEEITNVRMVAETVILEVIAIDPGEDPYLAEDFTKAAVHASFTMRNMGEEEEQMRVRFPLVNPDGTGDGYFGFPEIEDLRVWVGGEQVETDVLLTTNPFDSRYDEVKWATFEVTFPVETDVLIEVRYTLFPTGYLPTAQFVYILSTGAGWYGTIGSADIIVRLTYEASHQNVLDSEDSDVVFEGREARWRFEDFEPEADNYSVYGNFSATIVLPQYWQDVLIARAQVEEHPDSGDAWGNLARAYKLTLIMGKGWIRSDYGGYELYDLAVEAYENATSLSPNVARWHAGYGELLWHRASFNDWGNVKPENWVKMVQELRTALEIDPQNEQAQDVLSQIAYWSDWAVVEYDGEFDYPILTRTPTTPPTRTPTPTVTNTPTLTTPPTSTQTATQTLPPTDTEEPTREPSDTPAPTRTEEPPEETSPSPLCGSIWTIPLLLGFGVVINRRRWR